MEQRLTNILRERINILDVDLIDNLDNSINQMKAEFSAKGLLRSGDSVDFVKKEINNLTNVYYSNIYEYVKSLPLMVSSSLEDDLNREIEQGISTITIKTRERLKEIANQVRKPDLYEGLISELEELNSKAKRDFQNNLSAYLIHLSQSQDLGTKPWENEAIKIWRFVTKGNRKILTFPIVAIVFLVPAIASLSDSYLGLWANISELFRSSTSDKQGVVETSPIEKLIREGKLEEAKALQDRSLGNRIPPKRSINASYKIDTLQVSHFRGTSLGWTNVLQVSSGDRVSLALHYYLSDSFKAEDVRFFLDDISSKIYTVNDVLEVNGKVSSKNLETAYGTVDLSFSDTVKLSLVNISWQIVPCNSTECEEDLSGTKGNLFSEQGLQIGDVAGDATKVENNGKTTWDGHWAGNVVATFIAMPPDTH